MTKIFQKNVDETGEKIDHKVFSTEFENFLQNIDVINLEMDKSTEVMEEMLRSIKDLKKI